MVRMVKEEEDVRQGLDVLLSTVPGERVHRFDFGCGIRRFMYEPMTLTTQTVMREVLEKAILLYEPRVRLNSLVFDVSEEKEGVVYITIDYTVLRTNRRSNMVYPFYLREGTDL